jgi:hypothetical protein
VRKGVADHGEPIAGVNLHIAYFWHPKRLPRLIVRRDEDVDPFQADHPGLPRDIVVEERRHVVARERLHRRD